MLTHKYVNVNCFQNIHSWLPIASPLQRTMGCLLWILGLIYFWKLSLTCFMQCRVILNYVTRHDFYFHCTHWPLGYVAIILKSINFTFIIQNSNLGTQRAIAFRRMPENLTNEKFTLVQVMAWCRLAASHYLNQCWRSPYSPYGITRPLWVKFSYLCSCPPKALSWSSSELQNGRCAGISFSGDGVGYPFKTAFWSSSVIMSYSLKVLSSDVSWVWKTINITL